MAMTPVDDRPACGKLPLIDPPPSTFKVHIATGLARLQAPVKVVGVAGAELTQCIEAPAALWKRVPEYFDQTTIYVDVERWV